MMLSYGRPFPRSVTGVTEAVTRQSENKDLRHPLRATAASARATRNSCAAVAQDRRRPRVLSLFYREMASIWSKALRHGRARRAIWIKLTGIGWEKLTVADVSEHGHRGRGFDEPPTRPPTPRGGRACRRLCRGL